MVNVNQYNKRICKVVFLYFRLNSTACYLTAFKCLIIILITREVLNTDISFNLEI